MQVEWAEEFSGGSPEAERREFAELAQEIIRIQLKTQQRAGARGVPHGLQRALQAKTTFASTHAQLRFLNLPAHLEADFARSGATYPVTVRFSNASGAGRPDFARDLRGVALRIAVSPEQQHDLLLTTVPATPARNAYQYVKFVTATSGGLLSRAAGLMKLSFFIGPFETVRMIAKDRAQRSHPVRSLATQTYYSGGAIRWGGTAAVRYLLRPVPGTEDGLLPSRTDPEYLTHEMSHRLAQGRVRFELCLQEFRDRASTPIEDCSRVWLAQDAPVIPVAVLTITPALDGGEASVWDGDAIDAMAFNPWNTTDRFRPLGNLQRARKSSYDASAALRQGLAFSTRPPLRNVVVGGVLRRLFTTLNRWVPWYRLSPRAGLLNLEAIRHVLRSENLIDTDLHEAPPLTRPVPPPPDEEVRIRRTFDGTFNDLSKPSMGAVGSAFGRNLRPDYRPELFDEPNPITVSRELLYREAFQPARSLNLLAAAWIQFQVHDWVSHARYRLGQRDVTVPLPPGVPGWVNIPGGRAEERMRIAGNIGLGPDRPDGAQRLFANAASHWWDGSEIYGSDAGTATRLREGAKIRLTPAGYLPEDVSGQEITGFQESWWLGLSGLHTMFAREHNLICDELCGHYRGWSDDRVYHTARLIVSALIAKIHTVEWTPAILATKAIDLGMHGNWSGPAAHDWLIKLGLWLTETRAAAGIPKSLPEHGGAPYSLTEDFTTVYRMHPLLPDLYRFSDHRTGQLLGISGFAELQGRQTDEVLRKTGLEDMLYSFGIAHPGAITLHNYPRSLQAFERNGELIDLSVVDLVRSRRRGVPRYNDFRAGLHKSRITRWEDLSADPESVRRLRSVYRSIDEVDTMVGLFAETPPDGFGFSDTAFRIFVLMASRRLQSDRFLTVDFRPEIYSPFGMDWINNNGLSDVILRHCPDLASVVPRGANAFAPWRAVAPSSPEG